MLDTLRQRASLPAAQLMEPAPDNQQLEEILRCGLTAPDHAAMHPWQFISIRGAARESLGDVFVQVAHSKNPDISESKLASMRSKPLRSPLIVVVVATIVSDHPKTPEIEQVLSAGAAANQIQLAATAMGFGSVWLTGPNAYEPDVKTALGVDQADHIIGFLYIGTPRMATPVRNRPDLSAHYREWSGPA